MLNRVNNARPVRRRAKHNLRVRNSNRQNYFYFNTFSLYLFDIPDLIHPYKDVKLSTYFRDSALEFALDFPTKVLGVTPRT